MPFQLSDKSLKRLSGVHPRLQAIVKRAIEISSVDFTVIEGLRTKERQRYLVEKGASKTMNSYHLTGHAVDIAPFIDGNASWDWKHYPAMAKAMKDAAEELNVNLTWGGDWKTFRDGPHFQIAKDS